MLEPRRHLTRWLFQGVYRGDSLPPHLESIRRLRPRRDEVYAHDYLYVCLSILDAKAQVLLAYDALILAAASIVLTLAPGGAPIGRGLIAAALVTSGVSSVLCLTVVWVQWTDTDEFEQGDEYFVRLLKIRNRRTISYRVGWVVSHLAALFLIIGTPLQ